MESVRNIFSWLISSFAITKRDDAKRVVLCVMAATTFWFLNALNRDYSTKISCPIQFRYDDSNYVATTPMPEKVMLDVTGYGWILLKKTLGIDNEVVEYTITRPLRTKFVTAPFLLASVSEQIKGLRVNYVVEDTFYLNFDKRIHKTVNLKVDSTQIDLERDHAIVSPIRIAPRQVTFEGPSSVIRKIPSTIQIGIPSKRIDDSYEEEIKLEYVQDPHLTVDNTKISVSFQVEKLHSVTRRVAIQKVNFPASNKYTLSKTEVDISYLVRKSNSDKVDPSQFNIIADFKSMREDSSIVLFVEKKPTAIQNVMLANPYVKVEHVKK